MRLYNFRKESSERSDAANWAKQQIIERTPYHFDAIEGCNQNAAHQTTHLFERARVDIDLTGPKSRDAVIRSICALEGKEALLRKIRFAATFDLPLSYVLHDDASGYVFVLAFRALTDVEIVSSFASYEAFGRYLAQIKGWRSTKKFREADDLPLIDRVLRQHATPWPTNIDCFCTDAEGHPIAIIEFQNADSTGVLAHSNNDYFLCKQKSVRKTPQGAKVRYHDDIRRWTSQEILRIQSGLPLIVITWSSRSEHFQIKQVDKITFPDFEMDGSPQQWQRMAAYKEDLHRFISDPSGGDFEVICQRQAMSLERVASEVHAVRYTPPLSLSEQTFPQIYWRRKAIVQHDAESLSTLLMQWLSS